MSDEASSTDPESSPDVLYASQFRQHLAQVQAHLAGNHDSDLQPSFILPTGYWTSTEKDTFFHALSVYSRFRPDLVAACLPTKTVLDVCTYIDTLDEYLSRNRHRVLSRAEIEGAMEVSNAWSQWEEQEADSLITLEAQWEDEVLSHQHEEEVSTKWGLPKTTATGESDLESWERDRRQQWGRENSLKRLGSHHLKVLEGILKEAESRNVNSTDPQSEEHPSQKTAPLPSPPNLHSTARSHVSDEVIDPLLARLSGLPVPDFSLPETISVEKGVADVPHLEAFRSGSPLHDAIDPLLNNTCQNLGGNDEFAIDPSSLSPAGRRRFQKRLYMRRKRAAHTGETVIAVVGKLRPGRKMKEKKPPKPRAKTYGVQLKTQQETEATDSPMNVGHTGANLLPPPPTPNTANLPLSLSGHDDDDPEEGEDQSPPVQHQVHPNQSGLTKPYKIKKDFVTKGIDAEALIESNLGLFHLSTLNRFMGWYKSGFDHTKSKAASSISADTIRLMTAIIVEFTTEVVHRTIIRGEQEKHMKGGIKVYGRIREEISVEDVNRVLEMMGMKGLTRDKYFAKLLGEDAPEAEVEQELENDHEGAAGSDFQSDEGDENTDEEGEDVDNDGDILGEKAAPYYPATLPLHREIHPPLVRLPMSLAPLASDTIGVSMNDSLMIIDTDDDELDEELREEMELDSVDQLLAHKYEEDLWKQFGKDMKGNTKHNR